MQSSHTASPGKSIWGLVGQSNFENNVAALRRENAVPGTSCVYPISDRFVHEAESSNLSIDIERELADDFAFIAAYEEGVRTVTAAALEISPNHMKVVLAANEGIDDRVQSAFQDMFCSLEACARCESSRKSCADTLLIVVVNLNRNRIYGRLGSSKFSPPRHRRVSTSVTLPAQIDTLVRTNTSLRTSPAWDVFGAEMRQLHAKFRDVEEVGLSNDEDAIIAILRHIYCMTIDGISLPRRLRSLKFGTAVVEGKQMRQLMKLANYVRICDTLAEKARSLRLMFQHLAFQRLQPFAPATWRGEKRFVHAETQIVVHYIITKPKYPPRIIGASKEACFLCDSFVRAHGQHQLSRAHRQLFHLWGIPDLCEYEPSDLNHLRKCLQAVNQDLVKARLESLQKRRRRPFPLQSSINLVRAIIRNPSMSTIRSVASIAASTSTACLEKHVSTLPSSLQHLPLNPQCSKIVGIKESPDVTASDEIFVQATLQEEICDITTESVKKSHQILSSVPELNDPKRPKSSHSDVIIPYEILNGVSTSCVQDQPEDTQSTLPRTQSNVSMTDCSSEARVIHVRSSEASSRRKEGSSVDATLTKSEMRSRPEETSRRTRSTGRRAHGKRRRKTRNGADRLKYESKHKSHRSRQRRPEALAGTSGSSRPAQQRSHRSHRRRSIPRALAILSNAFIHALRRLLGLRGLA